MPSGRFPGGGAMRLSGLQNPQAAPTCSPGKHSATGEYSRVAADALPGLRNCPAYTFTAAIGTLSGGGAMRLSGLQNPQAARAGSPGKHSATGEHSRWRLTPYPGYKIARPTRSQPPSGRFPGGGAMRLSGLQNPQAARA
ncbi:MAG: hypothetical protein ACLR17_09700 [Enterobacteriaceae bacterium]